MRKIHLIAIAGGSGSGKTTLAKKLHEELGTEISSLLSQDSYYKDRSNLPFAERTRLNYDEPESLDGTIFCQDMEKLKSEKSIEVPSYDFASHTRMLKGTLLNPTPLILVEGTLLLSVPEWRELFDYIIFVEAASDIRLARRLRRDVAERGRSISSVLKQYFETVRPMHRFHVEPYKKYADFLFPNDEDKPLDSVSLRLLLQKLLEMV